MSIFEGSPAYRKGLRRGDIIARINGEDTKGWTSDDAVAKLQANPDINVTIEGHTDSIGTSEYNLALGERRANSVLDYLSMRGIAAGRLRTVSYGEERPIASNDNAAGRAMNRRAHLLVILQ